MKDIVIIGAGGLGKEVAWLVENINNHLPTWNVLGFLEDESKSELFGKEIYGYKVLGSNSWILDYRKEIYVTFAIGKSKIRKTVCEKVLNFNNVKLATLIDPSVRIDKSVVIGDGSIICKNCSITVDINIGRGVLMNVSALVGHDSEIGDYCTFSPHSMSAGQTKIGAFCEIGSGSFILQGTQIAENTIIAPLSSVLKDINESGTYIGNPARRIL